MKSECIPNTCKVYYECAKKTEPSSFLVTAHLQAYEMRDFQSSFLIWARVGVLDISNGHHYTNSSTLNAADITQCALPLPSTARQYVIRLLVFSKPSSKQSSKLHHPQHVKFEAETSA
jgi:hypothetical protein